MKSNYEYVMAISETMKVLQLANIDIKRSAVCVMIEDGILTEERKFQDYVAAKNIFSALYTYKNHEDKEMILTNGLFEENKPIILKAWNEYKCIKKEKKMENDMIR